MERHVLVLGAALLAACTTAAPLDLDLYINRAPASAEQNQHFTNAKYEPVSGCYLGAYIDLDSSIKASYKDQTGRDHKMPEEFEEQTARTHSTYFFYLGYGSRVPLDWIQKLGMTGKVVHIALEPNNGLEFVRDDEYLNSLAVQLANTKTPILLRFASEMNGKWLAWNGDPKKYIEKFRLVARIMKEKAPNVAMVWCPYATPARVIPDYYPGDDVVDWVGVNIYNVTFFDQKLTSPGSHVGPADLLDAVYTRYAAKKPIMIGEYGVTHFSKVENRATVGFAKRCLTSLYWGLPRRYPRVKAISYFCGNNLENETALNNNYAVTQNMEVLYVYQRLIKQNWFLSSLFDREAPATVRTPDFGRAKGDMLPYPWHFRPFSLKDSDRVAEGSVISMWCNVHEPDYKFVLKINGTAVASANDISRMEAAIPAKLLKPGRNEVRAEVWKGSSLASSVVRSVIAGP